jgi:oxygen-independent coproporphyrinogen-3 oxidase
MNVPAVGTFGVYVHFPYCEVRCTYCDFNTYVVESLPTQLYTRAVLAELNERQHDYRQWKLTSIYFGGGTPSLWGPSGVGTILRGLYDAFPNRTEHIEVTMECNPGEATKGQLEGYREAGVERLSLGVQTLDNDILTRLARRHTAEQAVEGLRTACSVGFRSVSADIMFGLPGQSMDRLTSDLRVIGELGPQHMSVYHLTLEEGTALTRDVRAGRISLPDDELQADMWEAIAPTLKPFGLRFYEVSSLSKVGHESRHNTAYWFGRPYLGLGAGAHSFCPPVDWSEPSVHATRRQNFKHHRNYTKRALSNAELADTVEYITPLDHLRERLFTGLRHLAGIDIDALTQELHIDARHEFEEPLERLVSQNLLAWEGSTLSLTSQGFTFADSVAAAFF